MQTSEHGSTETIMRIMMKTMKTNIGNKVQEWADHLERQINQNPMDMLGRGYPDSFISVKEEQTHEELI